MAFVRGANVVTDGLVLALDAANPKSYPGIGTTWSDLSGNGNSGSLTNGPTFSSTSGGNIQFDGVDDYINCGNKISTTTTITANAWVRLNINNDFQHIIDSSGNTWHLSVLNTGRIYFFDGSVFHNNGNILNINTWYMVTGIKTLTTNDIYLNGVISSTLNSTNSVNTNTVNIARWQGQLGIPSRYLNGNIAVAQIYNRALSPTEVLQNYNATKARFGIE